MIGIKTKVEMERTLYLDLPENSKKEDILKKAKEEVILPIDAVNIASKALNRMNIHISKLDLKDWKLNDVKQEIIK